MINENIQTALIREDDADWDVFLRAQLREYARGVNKLESITKDSNASSAPYTNSPFGDDWDLHWFGNCATEADEHEDTPMHIIKEDPSAIPDALYQRRRGIPNFTPPALWESNYTRAIFSGRHNWCTYGYGLSLRGAKRSAYLQAVEGQVNAIDQSFNDFCMTKTLDFKCHSVYPPLVGTHRPAGDPSKDSDREEQAFGGRRETASTVNIVFSMMFNARRLLEGKTTVLSQWPG